MDENVLGIQATIDSGSAQQGADEWIAQVNRMEQVADKGTKSMSDSFEQVNQRVVKLIDSVSEFTEEWSKDGSRSMSWTKEQEKSLMSLEAKILSLAKASDEINNKPFVSPEDEVRLVAISTELDKMINRRNILIQEQSNSLQRDAEEMLKASEQLSKQTERSTSPQTKSMSITSLSSMTENGSSLEDVYRNASKAQEELIVKQKQQQEVLTDLREELKRLNTEYDKLEDEDTSEISRRMKDLQKYIKEAEADLSSLNKSLSETSKLANAIQSPAEKAGMIEMESLRLQEEAFGSNVDGFDVQAQDELIVKFAMDVAEAQEELKGLVESQASLQEQLAQTPEGIDVTGITSSLNDVNNQIDEQKQLIESLSEQYQDAKDARIQAFAQKINPNGEARLAQAMADVVSQAEQVAEANVEVNQQQRLVNTAMEEGADVASKFVDNLHGLREEQQNMGSGLGDSVKKFNEELEKASGGTDKAKGSLSDYSGLIKMLPAPIQSAISSVQGLTTASLEFIATPVGAVLAALVLVCAAVSAGFKVVSTYLNSTVEGEMKLAQWTGIVNGVTGESNKLMAKWGERLWNVVEKFAEIIDASPMLKKALENGIAVPLGKAISIVENSIKILEDLASMIQAINSGDWSKVAELGKNIVTSWAENTKNILTTTVTPFRMLEDEYNVFFESDAAKRGKQFIAEAKKNTADAQKVAQEEELIRREQIAMDMEIAQKEGEIAELRNKIYQTNDQREKKRLIQQTKNLIDEKYNMQEELALRKLKLQQDKQALSPTNVADLEQEAQQVVANYRLKQGRESEKRFLSRMETSVNRQLNKGDSTKVEAYRDMLINLNNEMADMATKYMQDLQSKRISLMQEGAEKDIAEIQLDTDKMLIALEEQMEQLAKKKQQVDDALWASKGKGHTKENNPNRMTVAEIMKQMTENPQTDEERTLAENYLMAKESIKATSIDRQMEIYAKIASSYQSTDYQREQKNKKYDSDKADLQIAKQVLEAEIQRQEALDMTGKSEEDVIAQENRLFNLRKQLESVTDSLSNIDTEKGAFNLKNELSDAMNSLDWEVMFNDLDKVSTEHLNKLRENLTKYLRQGIEDGSISADDAKVLAERIASISTEVQGRQNPFNFRGKTAQGYENIRTTLTTERDRLQGQLNNATTDQQREKLAKQIDRINESLKEYEEEEKSSRMKALEFAEALDEAVNQLGQFGNLLDSLGLGDTGLGKFVGGVTEGTAQASSAMKNFSSGNYIQAAADGINALRTYGSVIGDVFGIGGGNADEVNRITAENTKEIQYLTKSVDNLKEEMMEGRRGTANSISAYKEAIENQKAIIKDSKEILDAQMGYSSAHHSNDYYINKNFSSEDWAKINSALNKGGSNATVHSAGDLWELSPEEMKSIQTYAYDMYRKIAEEGKYDKSEYLDQYIELAGTLEETTQQLNETLTGTTFDSMYDSFVSSLMDMDKSAEDFSKDFSNYMMQAMLNDQIGTLLSQELEDFYKAWGTKMQNGTLSQSDIEDMSNTWDSIVEKGINIRNSLAEVTGYEGSTDSSQSASSKSVASMSESTAEELNGRFTAVQIANESMNNQMSYMARLFEMGQADVSLMRETMVTRAQMSEIVDIQTQSNSYLSQIATQAKHLTTMDEKLTQIAEHTKRL